MASFLGKKQEQPPIAIYSLLTSVEVRQSRMSAPAAMCLALDCTAIYHWYPNITNIALQMNADDVHSTYIWDMYPLESLASFRACRRHMKMMMTTSYDLWLWRPHGSGACTEQHQLLGSPRCCLESNPLQQAQQRLDVIFVTYIASPVRCTVQ